MKKFKNFIFKYSGALCAVALFVVTHTANITCAGRFYQPEEPAGLAKLKKA